jgi:hypothetical protein
MPMKRFLTNALELHNAIGLLKRLKFEAEVLQNTNARWVLQKTTYLQRIEYFTLKSWNFESCRVRDEVQIH